MERRHDFVTCVVLWNKGTGQVDHVFSKTEWVHEITITGDASKSAGERLKAAYEKPNYEYSETGLDGFAIPTTALGAPSANDECMRKLKNLQGGQSRAESPGVHTSVLPTRKWPTVDAPKLIRGTG